MNLIPEVPEAERNKVEEFLSYIETKLSKQSHYHYSSTIYLLYFYMDDAGLYHINKLKRKHVLYWLKQLKLRRHTSGTVRGHIMRLRTYLRWLNELGYFSKDPDELIKSTDFPKLPKALPRPLSEKVDQQLIKRLSGSQNYLRQGLLLLRYTGLRMSDLLSLEYNCLTRNQDGSFFLKAVSKKLKKEYVIPIDSKAVELVRSLQLHAVQHSTQRGQNGEPHTLLNEPRGRNIGHRMRSTLQEIALEIESDSPITPHRLRHTYATSMLNAGMSIVGVMKLLGHSDLRMTLRYASLAPHTLMKEYQSILPALETLYGLKNSPNDELLDPEQYLLDLIRWIKNTTKNNQKASRIIKRIDRLKTDLSLILGTQKSS
jgi:site-specific recombinase XerD